MKMVKSLLLGSAAGLVAIAGAQAADLPVKAQPVQYVKICSLYGVGFYYIPGTDTCIKLGGWVRAETNWNAHGSFNPIVNGGDAAHTRSANEVNWRTRGILTLDTRSQTEYGTLRSYIAGGFQADNGNNPGGGLYAPRAFIQWAGFTAGLASSFYDFYVTPRYSNTTNVWGADTGGGGDFVWAYTAQLGNGFSATVSAEDPAQRRTVVYRVGNALNTPTGSNGVMPNNYAGSNGWPDMVANLRVDQAWGSAQIMGAIHQVAANYYGATEGTGHPNDEVGFAVGGGLKLNSPWVKGDDFTIEADYSEGALKYIGSGLGGFGVYNGSSVGLGWVSDAVYAPAGQGGSAVNTSLELTRGWSVVAGAQHHWNAQWKSSLYGAYGHIDYNSTATAWLNTFLCGTAACGGDSPDFSFWQVGTRTVWTPVQNLDLSVDVMYEHLNTSYGNQTTNAAIWNPGNFKPTAAYTVDDQDWWQVIFRAQRNFWP